MFRRFNDTEIELFLKKATRKSKKNADSESLFTALLLKIQKDWGQIVPQALAEHSFPWKIEKERLLVRADHGIFAQELKFQHKMICEKINRLYRKSISAVDIHVGPIYSKSNKTKDIMSRDPKMTVNEEEKPPSHTNKRLLEELIRKIETNTTNDSQ